MTSGVDCMARMPVPRTTGRSSALSSGLAVASSITTRSPVSMAVPHEPWPCSILLKASRNAWPSPRLATTLRLAVSGSWSWMLPMSAPVSAMAASTMCSSSDVESPAWTSRVLISCKRVMLASSAARLLSLFTCSVMSSAIEMNPITWPPRSRSGVLCHSQTTVRPSLARFSATTWAAMSPAARRATTASAIARLAGATSSL